ncbi:MAG: hypothetical protein VXW31_02975, partial [Planctomycetota bacterium]|nr:hypothetical protein [Planctomycetota bacterium]
MADSQNQGEKGRKPRPFGSFLLFLTVIVVVLVAFSGSALRNTQQFSQDEFLYHLVTGRVEQLKFKGQNGIEGTLVAGDPNKPSFFETSVASISENEAEWREMKAKTDYVQVQAIDLEAALAAGQFLPDEAWVVTKLRTDGGAPTDADVEPGDEATPPPAPVEKRTDELFVFGTTRDGFLSARTGGRDRAVSIQVTELGERLGDLRGTL